jgi:hypothetical protein
MLNQAGQPFPTMGLGFAQKLGSTLALLDFSVQPTAGMGSWTAIGLTLQPKTFKAP